MIRKIILILFISSGLYAQTGIGTTTPNASAKLDVSSTNKGFLPPRISLIDAYDQTTISSPATGLLVYCKGDAGLAAGYYFWNGNAWATIATAGGSGSVAAEFGTEVLAANVGITSSSAVDVLSFTIPTAGTWELIYFLRAQGAPGFAGECAIFDPAGMVVPNSEVIAAFGENASTGTGIVRITTTGGGTYKLKAWASSGTFNATSDYNGRTAITWKKISGNAPVTGQSVDYVSVMLTTDQSNSTAGQNVKFQTIQAGNIPYDASTGNFSLTAGKTYRLFALASLNGTSPAGSALDIIWRTADGVNIGPLGSLISANTNINFSGQGVVDYIFTPLTNTTVSLYISFVGNSTTVLRAYATNATITQIGSSAIVNPWTLSGTNTFNTTGKVGIGTNAPTQALDVIGNVKTSGNYMYSDGSTTAKKVAGYYNSEIYLSLDNIKVACTRNGAGGSMAGLSIGAVSTTFVADLSATYSNNGIGGSTATNITYSTTASNSAFGWGFGQGNQSTYILNDITNSRVYRIILMIGAAYNNNFISIERLL